jgi:glycosyltransferase involved in cell wall biosynthesis
VTLATSHFRFGAVPESAGYLRDECFYRVAPGNAAAKALQHPLDMARLARRCRRAGTDIVHFQWLPIPNIDRGLVRRFPRPVVLTAHDVTPREVRRGARGGMPAVLRAVDAVVVHSQAGAARVAEEAAVPPERIHVIPHGTFTHLAGLGRDAQPAALEGLAGRRVVLFFGLVRPYKGVDLLIEALAGTPDDVILLVVGMPRMSPVPLIERARALGVLERVRFVLEFVPDADLAAYFRRADLVVLPYREIEQSGVLYTALAFGSPLVLSAVGGFPEVAAEGAARLCEPGSAESLRATLATLLDDEPARQELSRAARALAERHSWQHVAALTEDLYRQLVEEPRP